MKLKVYFVFCIAIYGSYWCGSRNADKQWIRCMFNKDVKTKPQMYVCGSKIKRK